MSLLHFTPIVRKPMKTYRRKPCPMCGSEVFGEKVPVVHPPFQEGSRQHVIWWDSRGRHCSEPNCEVNR